MARVERGHFTRTSVQVDLCKPFLSKFKLGGRIWRIQYEGLKQIWFKCGKFEHREDSCDMFHIASNEASEAQMETMNVEENKRGGLRLKTGMTMILRY